MVHSWPRYIVGWTPRTNGYCAGGAGTAREALASLGEGVTGAAVRLRGPCGGRVVAAWSPPGPVPWWLGGAGGRVLGPRGRGGAGGHGRGGGGLDLGVRLGGKARLAE